LLRWYCRYGISYRELEEMMGERGVAVDHTTVYRWTQRYAPELEKRSAWYRSRLSFSWRVDETYVRVKGRWKSSRSMKARSSSPSLARTTTWQAFMQAYLAFRPTTIVLASSCRG
jgi:hypothetical protein